MDSQKDIYKSIANNIKSLRILHGYTQEKMAELLETTPRYYSYLENGDRNFTIEKIVAVSGIFNVPIEQIITVVNDDLDNQPSKEQMDSLDKKIHQLTASQAVLADRILDIIILHK